MIYCRRPSLFPFSLFSVESLPLVCGDHVVRAESASGVAGGCCSFTFGAAKGGKERLSQISPAAPEKNSGATGEKLRRRRRKSPVPLERNLRGLSLASSATFARVESWPQRYWWWGVTVGKADGWKLNTCRKFCECVCVLSLRKVRKMLVCSRKIHPIKFV